MAASMDSSYVSQSEMLVESDSNGLRAKPERQAHKYITYAS